MLDISFVHIPSFEQREDVVPSTIQKARLQIMGLIWTKPAGIRDHSKAENSLRLSEKLVRLKPIYVITD